MCADYIPSSNRVVVLIIMVSPCVREMQHHLKNLFTTFFKDKKISSLSKKNFKRGNHSSSSEEKTHPRVSEW